MRAATTPVVEYPAPVFRCRRACICRGRSARAGGGVYITVLVVTAAPKTAVYALPVPVVQNTASSSVNNRIDSASGGDIAVLLWHQLRPCAQRQQQ